MGYLETEQSDGPRTYTALLSWLVMAVSGSDWKSVRELGFGMADDLVRSTDATEEPDGKQADDALIDACQGRRRHRRSRCRS